MTHPHPFAPMMKRVTNASGMLHFFSDRLLDLVDSLPKLVCLYCSFEAPFSHLATDTKVLVKTFTQKRPSVRVKLISLWPSKLSMSTMSKHKHSIHGSTRSAPLSFVHAMPLI